MIILALIILIYYFLKIIYFFLKIILRILLFLVSILLLIKLLDSAQILSKFKLNTEDQKDKSETEVENQEKGEKSEDSSPENFGTED